MTIRETKDLRFLIRRGQERHIMDLYKNGNVYINTIDYIRQCDSNSDRSDSNDSIAKREFLGEIEVKMSDYKSNSNSITFNAIDGQLIYDTEEKGNIYCFAGLYNDHLLSENDLVEFSIKSFGESVIIILRPFEFIKRLKNALNNKGYKVFFKPVEYYNNDYSGEVGYFRKHENLSYQNEFRFYIPNSFDGVINLNIGSLEDIAVIHTSCFFELTLTDYRKKIIKIP